MPGYGDLMVIGAGVSVFLVVERACVVFSGWSHLLSSDQVVCKHVLCQGPGTVEHKLPCSLCMK